MRAPLIAALVVALAACGGDKNERVHVAELPDIDASVRLERDWFSKTGTGSEQGYLQPRPVVVGDRLYTVDVAGDLTAYRARDGKRLWRRALKTPVTTGLGADEGQLFFGTRAGELVAVDTNEGRVRWRTTLSTELWAPPVASEGGVVAATIDGKIHLLNAKDGALRWTQERSEPALSLRGTAAPAVSGDLVVAGFANGKLVAFERQRDGAVRWETVVAEPRGRDEVERLVDVDTTPLIDRGQIHVASYQGKVMALARETGAVQWAREVSTAQNIARDAKQLYVVGADGEVLAFEREQGASVWKQDRLSGRRLTAPAILGDYVAVGDYAGYVHLLRRQDGELVGRYRVGVYPVVLLLTHDAQLFSLDEAGTVSALRLRS